MAVELLEERATNELPQPEVHLPLQHLPDRRSCSVQSQRHALVGRVDDRYRVTKGYTGSDLGRPCQGENLD